MRWVYGFGGEVMALPEPLRPMCRHTVVVEPYSGQDAYGVRVYGTATSYAARVVGGRKVVKDATGKEVVSQTQVYLASDTQIDVKSRVTLPSGNILSGNTSQPPLITVSYHPDATSDGLSHSVLFL